MLAPIRTAEPAAAPVSLAEAKTHLNIVESRWDDLIRAYIEAATSHIEGYTGTLGGRALITQTWRQSFAKFPSGLKIRLPLAPAQTIQEITYHDAEKQPQTLPAETYSDVLTDDLSPFVEIRDGFHWPATAFRSDAVTVTFVAGYGDADQVPRAIKQAILLFVGTWFEQREDAAAGQTLAQLPENVGAMALLSRFKRIHL